MHGSYAAAICPFLGVNITGKVDVESAAELSD